MSARRQAASAGWSDAEGGDELGFTGQQAEFGEIRSPQATAAGYPRTRWQRSNRGLWNGDGRPSSGPPPAPPQVSKLVHRCRRGQGFRQQQVDGEVRPLLRSECPAGVDVSAPYGLWLIAAG